MSKKLRIFWVSNGHYTISGYGNQMAEILPRVKKEGYEQAICAYYGLSGAKVEIEGILTYPVLNHTYGSDALVHHARDFKADVSIYFSDQWTLHPEDIKQTNRYIAFTPIDHEPCPPAVLERLRAAYRIISYSKFGLEELKRHGLYSTYIPHTVDTQVFKPVDKKERKKQAGIREDIYVVGMVGANKDNPPRKSFQEAMDAYKLFVEEEPNSVFYIHTFPDQPGGFPIKQYAEFIGISKHLIFPDQYQMSFNYGKKQMAQVYNTFDMLLMPSISEGFGVPAIEAQACGVPVIVNNWASMPELVVPGKTGEICEVLNKRYDALGSYVGVPDTKSLYDCMMKIYRGKARDYRRAAREHIVKNYDTDTIYNAKWSPFLENLEKEIYP